MTTKNLLMTPPAAGGGALSGSYVTTVTSSANGTSYTFNATSIGTADADRTVVLAVFTRGTTSVTAFSATINGVSATSDYTHTVTGTGNGLGFLHLAVSTGTTADIVVTVSGGSQLRCGVGVYRVIGAVAVSDADSINFDASTSLSLTSVTDGFGVAVAEFRPTTPTWGGDVAADYQVTPEAGSDAYGASGAVTGATFGVDLTLTSTGNSVAAITYEAA